MEILEFYNPFKRLVCNLIFLIGKIAWIDV